MVVYGWKTKCPREQVTRSGKGGFMRLYDGIYLDYLQYLVFSWVCAFCDCHLCWSRGFSVIGDGVIDFFVVLLVCFLSSWMSFFSDALVFIGSCFLLLFVKPRTW